MLAADICTRSGGIWAVEVYLPGVQPQDGIVLGEAGYSSHKDSWTVEIFDENILKLRDISIEDFIDPDPMIR